MKKFSLLALVALLCMAFAGTSFADVKAKVTAMESMDDHAAVNNGAVATNSTNLYYFGDTNATGDVEIGAKFTTAVFDGAANDGIVGFIGDPAQQNVAATDPAMGASQPDNTAYTGTGVFSINGTKFSALVKVASIGAYAGTDSTVDPDATNGVDLTIVPTAVTFTPSKDAITLELTDTAASVEIAGAAGTGNTVGFELKADTDEVRVEAPNNAGIKVAIDTTDKKKINITPESGSFKAGTSTITVALKEATVKEGTLEDILVAGIDSSTGTEVATITVTVLPAATNSADIAGASKIEIVSGDAEGDIVISTDIISADAAAPKTIVGSTDVLIYGNLPSNFAETSRDVAAATRGGKDYYDVTLKKDDLNTLAPGSYTIYIGNIKQANPVRTDSVTITVIAPTPVPPTPSDDVVVDGPEDPNNDLLKATTNTIGVAEAIALVEAKGFAVAVNGLSVQTVVNAISNAKAHVWGTNSPANVTSLPIVSADIQNGGTIATIRVDRIPGSYLVSDDTRGRVVNANDLNVMKIVASNDVTRLARAGDVKGKTAEQLNGTFNVYRNNTLVDSVNSKSDDYELRVYIVDNGKYDLNDKVKGNVVDPLALVKSTGGSGSSSSSCDMGFGLAAVAGLAVLALRKRSK